VRAALGRPPELRRRRRQELIGQLDATQVIEVHVRQPTRRLAVEYSDVLGTTVEVLGQVRLSRAQLLPGFEHRFFALMGNRNDAP
jgi:hypothetical protein